MNRAVSLSASCLALDATIKDAILIIDRGHSQVALVLNGEKLVGVVTDGDVRRGILNGVNLNASVEKIMCKDFLWLSRSSNADDIFEFMKKNSVRHVPILDEEGKLLELSCLSDFLVKKRLSNPVLIMAGGEGKRLMPLTKDCPKPMIPIGDKPLLEIIFQQCINAGFCEFFFSVKYLKEQIKEYFLDGSQWGVSINYLEEEAPLGTAGALGLLPKNIRSPILVVNGDILTRVDFRKLLQFHFDNHSDATLCVREHQTLVPFGVAEIDGVNLIKIDEKPYIKTHVNAGIYIVEPALLGLVSEKSFIDMPQLLSLALADGHKVSAFPVHEYWLDIGQPETLARAQGEWF
jgi:dTDP-glucose pyrophosphorylase/predicted transcriptional regulator